ncbi:DNA-3-methyladenine glycosylase [Diaminobutyricimonas aerilata]|uniref:Putative 3-methyladenine DNA glycosylase n=1 Tax=Diaminobutyricimonas aerilata TaxID=1162967 RepID=A0A2M9CKR1_9MICO|nr:DNA-3-methyladenine glycosylase [Diaminobutyricimonas aerilata]PJJ72472.1 DNA-3-methyladenine glycosylase [Diaminobutyricimonas aerilata]
MFDRTLLERPAVEVAPLLLGSVIRRGEVAVRITEVEAYMGEVDPGSHAFRGRTNRNAVMYGPPGHLYTYFTYGMHTCANVVCMPEGIAGGVLLRAGRVVDGVEIARARRTSTRGDDDLAKGPARLVVALGITLADGGTDLESGEVRLELAEHPPAHAAGPRTGVSGAGGTEEYPWRFWVPGDPTVSPYKAHVPKKRGIAS